MRAVIFVNGQIDDVGDLAPWVDPEDRLVCADGGVYHCLAIGRTPDVIVGDLDSVAPELVARLAAEGAQIERHPAAKDQTDLELAIERCLREGAQEVLLLGALGGRLDQTLANVLILAQRRWPVPVRLAEGGQLAEVLHGGECLALDYPAGSTVSAIPLTPVVTGITYTGLAYALAGATLEFGSTRGISNTITTRPASIRIESGILLVTAEVGAES